jgi:hypothetical protein
MENYSSKLSSTSSRVFVAAITFLPSRCLAKMKDIYTDTQTDGFMKYAVEMSSGAMIYIPSFKKIGSGIQKLVGNTQLTQ